MKVSINSGSWNEQGKTWENYGMYCAFTVLMNTVADNLQYFSDSKWRNGCFNIQPEVVWDEQCHHGWFMLAVWWGKAALQIYN